MTGARLQTSPINLDGVPANLREGVTTPEMGVQLVAAFYECDRSVFERCDDSSGMIGDVFRSETQLPGEIHDVIGAGHQPIGLIQLHSDI